MDIPKGVNQAVIATWATLVIEAMVAAANKRLGDISSDKFAAYLGIYAICCIFPYKLSRGSNPTRYIFSILTVLGYILMLGETEGLTNLDVIISILLIPVYAFIIWRLFTGEANAWFTDKRPPALPNAK